MALSSDQLQSIIDLIRRDPEARRQLQAALNMDPLLQLPSRLDRIEAAVADLVAAQQRAEERLQRAEARLERAEARLEGVENRLARVEARLEGVEDRLARVEARLEGVEDRLARVEARLEGVEDRLDRLERIAEHLVESQQQLKQEVQKVSRWQSGEAGRRKGEQYERKIELQAFRLLGNGEGGSLQRDHVYQRLHALTGRLPNLLEMNDEADPMLADVIWWKGDRYAVVEVSIRVDRLDVLRAARRAETLRQAGVDALGVVIGNEWVAEDTEPLAREKEVAWKVGDDVSPLLVEFRQQAA